MVQKKDSLLRTVDREYGKLVLVWDGIKYGQAAHSNLNFKDDVKVSVPDELIDKPTTVRVECPATGMVDEPGVWKMIGFVGGKKGEETWRKEHARRKQVREMLSAQKETPSLDLSPITDRELAQALSHDPLPAPVEETQPAPENHPKRRVIPAKVTKEEKKDDNMATVRDIAKKYSFKLISQRIVLMFPNRESAAGFKVASVKRGWKVFDIGEATPGNHEIHIQIK